MKDETRIWLKQSKENLDSAEVLLQKSLFNPCLRNLQQCIENALKAIIFEEDLYSKNTHSIFELKYVLNEDDLNVVLPDDDCVLLDSIFHPSRQGVSMLQDSPDSGICEKFLATANTIFDLAKNIVKE